MASNLVTLVLNGDPTLDDLTTALNGLQSMLEGLEKDVAPGSHISWKVDSLERGSALVGFVGYADKPSTVEAVADAYLSSAKILFREPEPSHLPYESARRGARKILSILNGSVPSVRFETGEDDVTVKRGVSTNLPPASEATGAYGAVEGRIQMASIRKGLRFTLYDLVFDKAVSCYPEAGQEDVVRDAWGHIAIVEGWVKREPESGRPVTIRNVRKVSRREEAAKGDWRRAEGALRGLVRDEPPEATIRRIRAQ
jgi:hypothetical protein